MHRSSHETADAVRQKVETFVRAHFRLAGTVRLHAGALGWDLLRAPLNVMLAPVFLLVRLAGGLCRLVGLGRIGAWLAGRRILLPTSVAREVERLIATDLLEGAPLNARSRKLVGDYAGVRSAVSEITTSLIVLTTGFVLFGAATPGVVSLAPKVSGIVVHSSAVANFPLGARLGGLWYDVFPVSLPVWVVVATGIGLAMAASVVTTFAGILADPVQARLGIHRRRLLRLLDRIAVTEGKVPGLAPEHILARLADMTDAGLSIVRVFRS
jgi:hypothetical protein